MGNHELYMRRRKPDTIEVQQMKAQAREEKLARKEERDKLRKEIEAREAAERKQLEYAERLKQMQDEMERRQQELVESQETIRKLEEQLKQMQLAKEDLETKQNELEAMMKHLEESKNLEQEEKMKLEHAIQRKQEEVLMMKEEVQLKDDETRRLQDEVEAARKVQEEATAAIIAASIPNHIHVRENDENDDLMMNGADLETNSSTEIPRPEEDRETEVSKKKNLQEQLKMLSKDLAAAKEDGKMTQNDVHHQENVRQGRDKYKTLREIRKGNTRRRIDLFESI